MVSNLQCPFVSSAMLCAHQELTYCLPHDFSTNSFKIISLKGEHINSTFVQQTFIDGPIYTSPIWNTGTRKTDYPICALCQFTPK